MALNGWLSKKQGTFGKVVFGSEFLPWRMELKLCRGFTISSAWWVFQLLEPLISSVKICLWYLTHPDLSPNWRRNCTLFVTTPYERRLLRRMHYHTHSDFIKLCRPSNTISLWTEEEQVCEWYFVWNLWIWFKLNDPWSAEFWITSLTSKNDQLEGTVKYMPSKGSMLCCHGQQWCCGACLTRGSPDL